MNSYKKKLIEVALPLEAINTASAREKSIRHGHPSTLHLWWARRPLAAARAVIFAQMVDDPSAHPDLFPTEKKQQKERERLFHIIEKLVQWENTTNEEVLEEAREAIRQSWRYTCAENAGHPRAKELFDRNRLPAFHDPFAGGGALPLEAQRLGLESYASDLNPVAVLINKAMIEIPPKFAGRPPVHPEAQENKSLLAREWHGAQGLAEDVRYYGRWMRDQAEKRIGHLYPKVEITAEVAEERPDLKPYIGQKLTVIAWLWARTVKSPNPAFAQVDVPLASTFMLSTKPGKEAYVEPVIEGNSYRFTVKVGKPINPETAKNGTKLARGANFKCLMSEIPMSGVYIKSEGRAGRLSERLMAIVAEGERGRIYLSPTPSHEAIIRKAKPTWKPENQLPDDARNFWTVQYGLTTYGDLFTARQLTALTTFSDLVAEAMEQVRRDALAQSRRNDASPHEDLPLAGGGTGPTAYAHAIATYLTFVVDKAADYWSTICTWHSSKELIRNTFGRQAIPMTWDYAETNIFSESSGNISSGIEWSQKVLHSLPALFTGFANQDYAQQQELSIDRIVSTDPPYYDNIGYADLSDFFYVWLRRSLKSVFPDLFATLAVPKAEELIATPYRHGSKQKAEAFFLEGMTQAMHRLAEQSHPAFPVTIYYAFKQSETNPGSAGVPPASASTTQVSLAGGTPALPGSALPELPGIFSTGWETFLDAVIRAGFAISGTWPMRTELSNRMIGSGTNALASSIVLVCRRRSDGAATVTRREFVHVLKAELPAALTHLQRGNIAPVDLAQAAIGPGMAVYTRYARVLDAAGKPLSVRDALALINQTLDEALAEQEGDFDADSRWALTWFEQSGFEEGDFGVAEQLSKSKNTSVAGMVDAGILKAGRGKVRLLRPAELPKTWDPEADVRLTAWEMVHHLIRVLETEGEEAAGKLQAKLGTRAETARELCYRLYTLCERKKRNAEAYSYNTLVQSWSEITSLSQKVDSAVSVQKSLFTSEDAK